VRTVSFLAKKRPCFSVVLMQQPPQDTSPAQGLPAENPLASAAEASHAGQPDGREAQTEMGSEDGFQPIDPRFIPLERLASLILFIVTTIGSMVAFVAMLLSDAEPVFMILAGVGLTLLCVSLLWSAVFWPPIEYRHSHWKLSEVGLEIRRGVLWKHQIAIPWARAQHADVSQGPLQRMFEIGSLTIHTAGTKNSSVTIDGLAHTRAIELRDEIIRQRKEHDVV